MKIKSNVKTTKIKNLEFDSRFLLSAKLIFIVVVDFKKHRRLLFASEIAFSLRKTAVSRA